MPNNVVCIKYISFNFSELDLLTVQTEQWQNTGIKCMTRVPKFTASSLNMPYTEYLLFAPKWMPSGG